MRKAFLVSQPKSLEDDGDDDKELKEKKELEETKELEEDKALEETKELGKEERGMLPLSLSPLHFTSRRSRTVSGTCKQCPTTDRIVHISEF